MNYPIPTNEADRLKNLESFDILDTASEQEYDDITYLVAHICNTPISTIAFIDSDRKWHKSKYGIDSDHVLREHSICSHTIMDNKPLIIPDTLKHESLSDIGMVVNAPHIRFYAGIPLISPEGFAIGTLCALDTKPHNLSNYQLNALTILARSVSSLLIARRNNVVLEENQNKINRLNKKLEKLSRTDELTGLGNRRVLNETLKRELKMNSRGVHKMSVMMLDIDNLKSINDNFGHLLGDEVICLVANVLKSSVRETDYCIRYGGDEFVIIIPNMNRTSCEVLANHILDEIKMQSPLQYTVSISIGIAVVDGDKNESDNVLQLADQCLYLAKKNGKNRVEIHSS